MDQELEDALFRDFPLTYKICKSINCGNGWEPAIRKFSSKLEEIIAAMPAEEQPKYYVRRIKSKRAMLHFHLDYENSEISTLIKEAYKQTESACEDCGEPGKERVNSSGWVTIECDTCFQ